ncbi:MAG: hypothetical protein MZU91_06780 [Desulfosudis oleivorans]|nr:hypothetical protein [Desulfosudis oleivorans]
MRKSRFARNMKMELKELEDGFSAVEMTYEPEAMDNLFRRAHGGGHLLARLTRRLRPYARPAGP